MKKILTFLFTFLLLFSFTGMIAADEEHVIDEEGLLTEEERYSLEEDILQVKNDFDIEFYFYYDFSIEDDEIVDLANSIASYSVCDSSVALLINENYYCFGFNGYAEKLHDSTGRMWEIVTAGDAYPSIEDLLGFIIKEINEDNYEITVPILDEKVYLYDAANLLSEEEENEVLSALKETGDYTGMDIVAVTTDTLNSLSPMAYADDFYDYNGYSNDGVLFLVSMEDRDWWISTKGKGIETLTDHDISSLEDSVIPYLSSADYKDAFILYAKTVRDCYDFLTGKSSRVVILDQKTSVYDGAGLLDPSEEKELKESLDIIKKKYGIDAAIATVDHCNGLYADDYADEFAEYNLDEDSILLLLSMEDRDWWISTSGKAVDWFTDYGINVISGRTIRHFSKGNYMTGFMTFSSLLDKFCKEASTKQPYDRNHIFRSFEIKHVCIAAGIGAISALILMIIFIGQLRTVAPQRRAQNYILSDSVHIGIIRDVLINRTVHRTKIDHDSGSSGSGGSHHSSGGSSTHFSSSGSSHGGGGGKF